MRGGTAAAINSAESSLKLRIRDRSGVHHCAPARWPASPTGPGPLSVPRGPAPTGTPATARPPSPRPLRAATWRTRAAGVPGSLPPASPAWATAHAPRCRGHPTGLRPTGSPATLDVIKQHHRQPNIKARHGKIRKAA